MAVYAAGQDQPVPRHNFNFAFAEALADRTDFAIANSDVGHIVVDRGHDAAASYHAVVRHWRHDHPFLPPNRNASMISCRLQLRKLNMKRQTQAAARILVINPNSNEEV